MIGGEYEEGRREKQRQIQAERQEKLGKNGETCFLLLFCFLAADYKANQKCRPEQNKIKYIVP